MSEPVSLDSALSRLAAALDSLDQAASLKLAHEGARPDVEAELAIMQEDRARLAEDLDAATARGARLDNALAETAERVDRAIAGIRAALDAAPEEPEENEA